MSWIIYSADEHDDFVHIVPSFGREHDFDCNCWCHPDPDDDEENLLIHNAEM